MRRSLRARILIGLGIIIATLSVVAAVLIGSVTRLGSAIAVILRENYASVIACEDMKEALERQDSAAQFWSTGHDAFASRMLVDNRAAFGGAFAREARNITLPGERERVQRIDVLYREYVARVDDALAAPDRAERYFTELLPRFTRIKDEVQAVLRMNQQNMEDADGRAKELAARSLRIAVTVSALALVFAAWFAWRLHDAVIRPLDELTRTTRRVAEGDLEIELQRPDVLELRELADAYRGMIAQLRVYRDSSLGELLAAKDLANATIECLVDPVAVFGPDGDVLLTNDAAEKTFGLRAGSAEELRADDVTVPDEFTSARDRVFATGRVDPPRNFADAMKWRTREGERWFVVRAAPLRAEAGEKPRAIVVAQDVTRFRRIDELKTDMVATVSHEFKTPLTSLRMATHLLLEPATGALTSTQREIVTTARDDTERLRAMVDELLDLVRIEAEAGELRKASVDPRRVLRAVLDAHRSIAREKGVDLFFDDGAAVGTATVDPEKLTIVISNLVSNAIRHTPTGGRVSLAAVTDGSALKITVRDTGEGVAPETLPRLLTRPPGTRTQHGLGLTIARGIVLQHGGELAAESAPGEGSTFTVTIPNA